MKPGILWSLVTVLIISSCKNNDDAPAKERATGTLPTTALAARAKVDASNEGQMLSSPSAESIIDALNESGVHIYNINLPKLELEKYELVIYRDTYLDGVKSTKAASAQAFELGATDYTNAQNQYTLALTLIDKGDSLLKDCWRLPTGSKTITTSIKDRAHFIDYNVTPFKNQQIVPGKKIPVLVYGSSWKDEKTGYLRYCMERELEPDFSNDAFKKMPGYYVYSIELKKAK